MDKEPEKKALPRRGMFRDAGPMTKTDEDMSRAIRARERAALDARKPTFEDRILGRLGPLTAEQEQDLALYCETMKGAVKDALKSKRGRPSIGKPWEAEGISRATYFRNRPR